MGRYAEGVCRLCRREGEKLFLKGKRCLGPKCGIERKNYPPGAHTRRTRPSNFGMQLREKQKVKRIYGIYENQFKNYFQKAERIPGITGSNLLQLLELRLDNVVYRLGWAESRSQARQIVNHGHISVDGKKVTIPSFHVRPGSLIGLTGRGEKSGVLSQQLSQKITFPAWLKYEPKKKQGEVLRAPTREEIEARIEEQLIVEFYSR